MGTRLTLAEAPAAALQQEARGLQYAARRSGAAAARGGGGGGSAAGRGTPGMAVAAAAVGVVGEQEGPIKCTLSLEELVSGTALCFVPIRSSTHLMPRLFL